MAEPLKNVYNREFFDKLCNALCTANPTFNSDKFVELVHAKGWEDLELKGRMRRISESLRSCLDSDYEESLNQIIRTIKVLSEGKTGDFGYEYMFFPDYVERFGLDHVPASLNAMTSITQFSSCEFAIRPFILQDAELMYKKMMSWAVHKNKLVRRLASEGFRPRLPWAMALPALKKDPSPLLPMLDLLKTDEAETVRLSVANNLNDISKDHPELVIELASKWIGDNKLTDWVLKHACRTLLKAGNQKALELFGLGYDESIKVTSPELKRKEISLGEDLEFTFCLENISNSYKLVRLEYAIHYQKANGSLSKKVYKISEKEYAGEAEFVINRKQSFKPISTRKFHTGIHKLALVINGKEFEPIEFNLSIK